MANTPSLRVCEPYCHDHCRNLRGNVELECSTCDATHACNPAAADFSLHDRPDGDGDGDGDDKGERRLGETEAMTKDRMSHAGLEGGSVMAAEDVAEDVVEEGNGHGPCGTLGEEFPVTMCFLMYGGPRPEAWPWVCTQSPHLAAEHNRLGCLAAMGFSLTAMQAQSPPAELGASLHAICAPYLSPPPVARPPSSRSVVGTHNGTHGGAAGVSGPSMRWAACAGGGVLYVAGVQLNEYALPPSYFRTFCEALLEPFGLGSSRGDAARAANASREVELVATQCSTTLAAGLPPSPNALLFALPEWLARF